MGSKQPTASKEMISKRLLCLLSTLMAVALVNSKSADLVRRINKASIDVCLEGWLRGEASIIGAHADQENFYFEWVPTGQRFPFAEFPAFYNVTFYNFIQWEEGTQLYESAQCGGRLRQRRLHTAGGRRAPQVGQDSETAIPHRGDF